jgi:hypothetical protein
VIVTAGSTTSTICSYGVCIFSSLRSPVAATPAEAHVLELFRRLLYCGHSSAAALLCGLVLITIALAYLPHLHSNTPLQLRPASCRTALPASCKALGTEFTYFAVLYATHDPPKTYSATQYRICASTATTSKLQSSTASLLHVQEHSARHTNDVAQTLCHIFSTTYSDLQHDSSACEAFPASTALTWQSSSSCSGCTAASAARWYSDVTWQRAGGTVFKTQTTL